MKLESLKMNLQSLKSQVNNEKGRLIKGKSTKIADAFMQNKANFKNIKIGVSSFQTSKYEILPAGSGEKTNPIQTQTNPIYESPQMNANIYDTEIYDNKPPSGGEKTNPIQTQNKPNQASAFVGRGANKMALKIYPFGIDCPIVFEEKLFWFVG